MPLKVQAKKDRLLLIVLTIHFFTVLFYSLLTDHFHTTWVSVLALLVPVTVYWFQPGTLLSRSIMAISLVVYSAILIHLSNGLVEMHFHIFASLVLLAIYYDWKVIMLAAAAVSAHHLYGLLDQQTYRVYALNPDLTIYLLHILFVVLESAVLCYLTEISRRNLQTIRQQNATLRQLLDKTESKRELGEVMSQRINAVSMQLNATSTQQASGSQQQVSALAGVLTSLIELSETARTISAKTDSIRLAANEVIDSVQQVKETTGAVTQVSERGSIAVERTLKSNQTVSELYEDLVQRLSGLRQRSHEMETVSKLLKNISDQTHLLALNAAIEAAGAGEYGERFGVVAQEIKALANRSIRATEQVSIILKEVEAEINQAVETVENGHQQTSVAVAIAQESGMVIEELGIAIQRSAEEVTKIQRVVNSMNELTEDISYATTQQHQASTEVVEALQSVDNIARLTATGSREVRSTTRSLEELSEELQKALVA